MKRNLLKGIILISAVALSSCSTITSLSKTEILADDAYHTKAKAGDSFDYNAQYTAPQAPIVRNDDYYYYGDYESRINRFNYFTPFDYDDDFYYSYAADDDYYDKDSKAVNNNTVADTPIYDDYEPVYDDLGVYDAYDFGYGDFGGYDNFGYGVAYSSFVYGGGSRANYRKSYSHSKRFNNTAGGPVFVRANGGGSNISRSGGAAFSRSNGNVATNNGQGTFTRANVAGNKISSPIFSGTRPGGNNAVYPGRPGTNSVTTVSTNSYIRPQSQNPRPVIEQPNIPSPSLAPSNSSSSSSSSSGSSSRGSSGSSGGGGRPVRP
jgi:hypothetical protein